MPPWIRLPTRAAALPELLRRRIVILDGAMGTMIQHKPPDTTTAASLARDHPKDLKGNNDLLSVSRPDVIGAIHDAYLTAGADIIVETNTFGASAVAQDDYGLAPLAREMNGRRELARAACRQVPARPATPGSWPARSAHATEPPASAPTSTTRRPRRQLRPAARRLPPSRPKACTTAAATCSWSRPSSTRAQRQSRHLRSTVHGRARRVIPVIVCRARSRRHSGPHPVGADGRPSGWRAPCRGHRHRP